MRISEPAVIKKAIGLLTKLEANIIQGKETIFNVLIFFKLKSDFLSKVVPAVLD